MKNWGSGARKKMKYLDALEQISKAGQQQNDLLRRYNVVFNKWPKTGHMPIVLDGNEKTNTEGLTPEEFWQSLAFTLHTNIWEMAQLAESALEEDE